jgi:hypothetical protein
MLEEEATSPTTPATPPPPPTPTDEPGIISSILTTTESYVNYFGKRFEDLCQYTGLQVPNDGSPNLVERSVTYVETYTGALEETILSPPVLIETIDSAVKRITSTTPALDNNTDKTVPPLPTIQQEEEEGNYGLCAGDEV